MKWIAHIYLANFYSSVLLNKPEPAEKPLVILKHNRVLDATLDTGVKLRSSRRHAYQACPGALFLNFAAEDYQAAVEDILTECLEYTPVLEPVAENEFYLELSGPHEPDQVIRELTSRFIPAFASGLSAGIGTNKFLARLANMLLAAGRVKSLLKESEPAGKFYWFKQQPGEETARFLSELPLNYLWVLDGEIIRRLSGLGFKSIGDISVLELTLLHKEFGNKADMIKDLTWGKDLSTVLSLYPPKNISKEYTFDGGIVDFETLVKRLEAIADELSALLESRGEGCRRLILQLKTEKEQSSKTRRFNKPQSNPLTLREVLKGMAGKTDILSPLTDLQVIADDLRPMHGTQLVLFEDPKALAGKNSGNLENLLESMGKRFSAQNFHFGKDLKPSRREQMLEFWDPLRFKEQSL